GGGGCALPAEPISADEALRLGLINKVVPLSELMPAARALAETLCERGPLALRAAKEAIIRGLSLPLDDGLRLEALLAGTLRGTEDAAEGPKAFAEKRKPTFKARGAPLAGRAGRADDARSPGRAPPGTSRSSRASRRPAGAAGEGRRASPDHRSRRARLALRQADGARGPPQGTDLVSGWRRPTGGSIAVRHRPARMRRGDRAGPARRRGAGHARRHGNRRHAVRHHAVRGPDPRAAGVATRRRRDREGD